MTTQNVSRTAGPFNGNGATTSFPFNYKVLNKTHLVFEITDPAGVVTEKVLDVDFSVALNADQNTAPGGAVTYPLTGSPLAVGYTCRVLSRMPVSQLTSLPEGGSYRAAVIEDALDNTIMILKEQAEALLSTVRAPAGETLSPLPAALARAGYYLGFDGGGNLALLLSATGTAGALASDLSNTSSSALGDALLGVKSLLTAAVATTQHEVNSRRLDVFDFMTTAQKADALTYAFTLDMTAAFQAASDAAAANGNKTVHVTNAGYRINGTVYGHQGIMFSCEGSQGSNQACGTVFMHYNNVDCFVWDGNGADFKGTGGGLKNALIMQKGGPGGNAIKVLATSDDKRPGEMFFENVLTYSADGASSLWARGFLADGTAANTAGTRGVRSIHMKKCRFADTSTANECVVLNQVSHFFADGLQTDVGSGVDGHMLVKGINDGIFVNGLRLGGNLKIVANDATNATNFIHLDGAVIGTIDNLDTQVNGLISVAMSTGAGYVLLNSSKHLRFSTSINPSFELSKAAAAANVTGDGTAYQVVWDTENYDAGSNVTAGSNTFTAYCAGRYKFEVGVTLSGVGAAHTRLDFSINQTGSVSRSHARVINPYALQASGFTSATLPVILDLARGDVVNVQVQVSGGTKVVGVYGGAGTIYSWLSGEYLS